jgi:hypothetical protein
MKIGADKTVERELAFLAPRRPFYPPALWLAIFTRSRLMEESEKRWRSSCATK